MKIKILLISLTVLLSSCVSTKKYTSYVEPKIQDIRNTRNDTSSLLTFDFSALENENASVVSNKTHSFHIPAIIFWMWETSIKCDIDPKIMGNLFKNILFNMQIHQDF
jgi:hypothetical protein